MSVLMEQRVDWSTWASTAQPLTCPACQRPFRPNHPRRRFCGAPDCPGRTRRRNTTSTPRPRAAPRPRRARRKLRVETNQLAGLLADATLALNSHTFEGTAREVAVAAAELVKAIAAGRAPVTERELTVRLVAAATARATALNPHARRADE